MSYYPSPETGLGGVITGFSGTEFVDWMGGWGTMVVLSMMVVIFFYGLVYMLAYAFNVEELKRSTKSHLYDALFTALLAVMVLVILNGIFQVMLLYFSGASVSCDMYGKIELSSGVNPFDFVECKLTEKATYMTMLYERIYFSARDPFKKFGLMWGLFGIPIYMQGAYIWQTQISQLYTQIESYRMLAHISVLLLIALNAYIGAIHYISANMLTMFLPIGIVLRAIPFTRGIGAFFIALALGFYIIFPFLFVITDPSFIKVPGMYVDLSDPSAITFPWPTFSGAVSIITMAPQTQTGSDFFGAVSINEGAAELSKLYYGLILQPIVILSITLIFVRYLTTLFGGESQEIYRLASRVI
ncbi:MAG: hypothetical protein WC488_00145 [Candidatus Micrarchaeia archaeon]